MVEFMRWAVTFAFTLDDEEKGILRPIIEVEDLALLHAAVAQVCAAHGFGDEGAIITDMWDGGDDTEMEMV